MHIILRTIVFLILFIPVTIFAAEKSPIKMSMHYGGVYQENMVVFLKVETPKNYKTYWRVSGFGGIAPEFSFDKNMNIEDMKIIYGFPKVYSNQGLVNYVLQNEDYIALSFRPFNPSQPVQLKGKVVYGYCDKLCMSGTYEFNQTFIVDQAADEQFTRDFFNKQPTALPLNSKLKVDNLVGYYKPNKNLLVSFQINGLDYLSLRKFVYYIDTDFEIKTPIIRKLGSNRYDITIDLYDVYEKPQTLTLMLPDNNNKIIHHQLDIPYRETE